jgi:hypothetical protein
MWVASKIAVHGAAHSICPPQVQRNNLLKNYIQIVILIIYYIGKNPGSHWQGVAPGSINKLPTALP